MTEYQGPELNTVESIIKDIVTRVLGTLLTSEDLGKFIGPSLADTITDALPKSLRSAVTSTSLTPEGVYMRSRRNRINTASEKIGTAYLRQSTIHMFEDIQRASISQASWEESEAGKSAIDVINAAVDAMPDLSVEEQNKLKQRRKREAYNKYITDNATSHYDTLGKGKVYETLNSFFGFTDAPATAGNLQATARNVATNAYDKNISEAIDASKIVTGHLFTAPSTLDQYRAMEADTKGSGSRIKRFDASEWGGMASSAVSGLAQELTKSTDVLAGVDTKDADSVRQAAFRFKETVRSYAKALEPLKDVFGDDIKKMTKLMETMSGQSLPQMSAAAVDSISARIATGMSNGTFNAQDLMDMRKGVQVMVSGMKGLDPFHYTGVQSQAVLASEIKGGAGATPYWRTGSQWKKGAQYFATDTANSSGADILNKGLVLYAQRRGVTLTADNMGSMAKEYSDAIKEYKQDPRNRGISLERASMAVAGVRSPDALNAATGDDAYRDVTIAGVMNGTALRMRAEETVDRAKLGILRSTGFRTTIEAGSRAEASRIYDKATTMAMDNAELLAATRKEDKIRILQSMDPNMSDAEARQAATALTYIVANNAGVADAMVATANANKAAAATKQAETRRLAYKDAGIKLFGSTTEFMLGASQDVDATIKRVESDTRSIQAIGDALGTSHSNAEAAAVVAALGTTNKDDAQATVESLIQGTGKNAKDVKKAFDEFKALKEQRDTARNKVNDSKEFRDIDLKIAENNSVIEIGASATTLKQIDEVQAKIDKLGGEDAIKKRRSELEAMERSIEYDPENNVMQEVMLAHATNEDAKHEHEEMRRALDEDEATLKALLREKKRLTDRAVKQKEKEDAARQDNEKLKSERKNRDAKAKDAAAPLEAKMELKALQIQAYKEGDVEAVNAIINDKDTDDETKQSRLRNYLRTVDKKDTSAARAIKDTQKASDKLDKKTPGTSKDASDTQMDLANVASHRFERTKHLLDWQLARKDIDNKEYEKRIEQARKDSVEQIANWFSRRKDLTDEQRKGLEEFRQQGNLYSKESVQSLIKEASADYAEYRAKLEDPTTAQEFSSFLTGWAKDKKKDGTYTTKDGPKRMQAGAVDAAVELIQKEIESSKKDDGKEAGKGALDDVDKLISKFAKAIGDLLTGIEKWRGDTTDATRPDRPTHPRLRENNAPRKGQ